MKILFATAFLFVTAMSFAGAGSASTLVCTSKDYNPKTYDGQGLYLTIDKGVLVKAEKMPGSWYSDSGVINGPKLLSNNGKVAVYEANFGDDYNGRVILLNGRPISYQFSYADDERNRTVKASLTCKAK